MSALPDKTWIWFVKEYFKSPFVWWGVAFHIIGLLGLHFAPAEDFRTLLWTKQYHIVFFIPMMLLSIFDVTLPYHKSMKKFARTSRANRKAALIVVGLLAVALWMDPAIIPFEVITIIGDQNKHMVHNYSYLVQLEEVLGIYSFVTPLILVYDKLLMRRMLEKSGNLALEQTPEWMIPITWMTFISLLIGFSVIIDP